MRRIQTTDAQENKIREALQQPNAVRNEAIWNYLIADMIACSECPMSDLFGVVLPEPNPWFEAMPMPPRNDEGNSRIDLALGDIRRREGTDNGIEFDGRRAPSWVGFVEAKLLSDCSLNTTNDPARNQITRVIENLLCFQSEDGLPDNLYFTILIPRYFKQDENLFRSRLYGYKFHEYLRNSQKLVDDIELCELPKRVQKNWKYPETLRERTANLKLYLAAYEDILAYDPELQGVNIMKSVQDGLLPEPVRARLYRSLSNKNHTGFA